MGSRLRKVWRRTARRHPWFQEGTPRTDGSIAHIGLCQAPVDQHVAIGRVRAVMFPLEVAINAANLLPLDHDQSRVDGGEGGEANLYVSNIQVADLNAATAGSMKSNTTATGSRPISTRAG